MTYVRFYRHREGEEVELARRLERLSHFRYADTSSSLPARRGGRRPTTGVFQLFCALKYSMRQKLTPVLCNAYVSPPSFLSFSYLADEIRRRLRAATSVSDRFTRRVCVPAQVSYVLLHARAQSGFFLFPASLSARPHLRTHDSIPHVRKDGRTDGRTCDS